MVKDHWLKSLLSVTLLSLIAISLVMFFVYQKRFIGLVLIFLGFLHLLVLKMFGVSVKSLWPDMIFGIIDNGVLVIGAIIGADFAGVLGAIIGGAVGNAITDGYGGIFEGWTAEYLRKHNIKEKRTALSSALGKMAGCFFGAGVVLVIAWTLFSL